MTHYLIDGIKIEVETLPPCTDVRFFAQQKLIALNTPAAKAELARRAAIIAARG